MQRMCESCLIKVLCRVAYTMLEREHFYEIELSFSLIKRLFRIFHSSYLLLTRRLTSSVTANSNEDSNSLCKDRSASLVLITGLLRVKDITRNVHVGERCKLQYRLHQNNNPLHSWLSSSEFTNYWFSEMHYGSAHHLIPNTVASFRLITEPHSLNGHCVKLSLPALRKTCLLYTWASIMCVGAYI